MPKPTVEDVRRLQGEIARLKEQAARSKGRAEQLGKEGGPQTLRRKLAALDREIAAAEKDYEEKLAAYREGYDARFV